MSENLRLNVDSTGAVRGLDHFEKSLDEALASADRFSRKAGGGIERVVDKIGKLRKHPFSKVAKAMDQNAKRAEKLARSADRTGNSFARLSRRSRGLTGNMRGLENSMNLTFQAGTLLRSLFGFLTLRKFGSDIIDATMSLERFRSVLTAVHQGSLPKIQNEMDFVNQTAHDLAISIDVARKSYGNFSAAAHFAGRTTEETQEVFRNISMALRVMGKSADDQKLAFMALEQMFSKGRVQSEELRRQLGERIPGAVKIFADAAGVGTAEFQHMMKTGKVGVDVILKASQMMESKFRGGLLLALDRVDTKMTRLSNAWQNLLVTVGNSDFLEEFKRQLDAVTRAIKGDEFQEFARQLGTGLARATRLAGEGLVFVIENAELLGKVILAYTAFSLTSTVIGWAGAFGQLTKSIIASEAALKLFNGTAAASSAANVGAAAAGSGGGMFGRIGKGLGGVSKKIGALLTSVPLLGRVFASLGRVLGPVLRVTARILSVMGMFNPVVAGVVAVFTTLATVLSVMKAKGVNWGDFMVSLAKRVGTVFSDMFGKLGEWAGAAWAVIAESFGGLLSKMTSMLSDWWDGIKSFFSSISGMFADTGVGRATADMTKGVKEFTASINEAARARERMRNIREMARTSDDLPMRDRVAIELANTNDVAAEPPGRGGGAAASEAERVFKRKMQAAKKLRDELFPLEAAQRKYNDSLKQLAFLEANTTMTKEKRLKAEKRLARAYEDQLNPYDALIKNMERDVELAGLNADAREKQIFLEDTINDMRAKGIDLTNQQIAAIERLYEKEKKVADLNKNGWKNWADNVDSFGVALNKVEEQALSEFSDAMTDALMTGKLEWRELGDSILRMMTKVIVDQTTKDFLNMFRQPGGSGGGGFLQSIFGGGAGVLGGLFGGGNAGVDIGMGLGSGMNFGGMTVPLGRSGGLSSGGILDSATVPMKVFNHAPHFSEGGATGGIPAVLHDNEAVVPLSRGREIPVRLQEDHLSDRNADDPPINVTFNFPNGDADSFRRSQGQVEAMTARTLERAKRRNT